jgi:cell division topological specificity factor
MSNWLNRLFGRDARTSAQSAKERLQLVLIHDRTDLSPALLDTLKDEMIAVISKHVEIDPGGVEINLSQTQRENRLVANIPLLAAPAGRRRFRK